MAYTAKRDEITEEEMQTGERSSRPEPWAQYKVQGDEKEQADEMQIISSADHSSTCVQTLQHNVER